MSANGCQSLSKPLRNLMDRLAVFLFSKHSAALIKIDITAKYFFFLTLSFKICSKQAVTLRGELKSFNLKVFSSFRMLAWWNLSRTNFSFDFLDKIDLHYFERFIITRKMSAYWPACLGKKRQKA